MEDNIELIVTSIKELTKKRRLVYINYEPAFALYAAELRKFGIKDGESVRKEAYDSLIDDVLSKRATVRAMALLKNKDYTRKGLEDKLRDGYYPDMCIDYALEYVTRFGYINDERYARTYIAYRMDSKSRQKILQELIGKGVDRDIAVAAWEAEAALNTPDEHMLLIKTVEKKIAPGSELNEREMRRLYGYLIRRGFQGSDISHVLEELEIKFSRNFLKNLT